jgi:hypothetical protein
MHSRENDEFWSALLEKAYAKLYGSYEALKGGTTSEALEDMTGGLTEFYDLNQPPENILQLIVRGFEMGSMFGCSLEGTNLNAEFNCNLPLFSRSQSMGSTLAKRTCQGSCIQHHWCQNC